MCEKAPDPNRPTYKMGSQYHQSSGETLTKVASTPTFSTDCGYTWGARLTLRVNPYPTGILEGGTGMTDSDLFAYYSFGFELE